MKIVDPSIQLTAAKPNLPSAESLKGRQKEELKEAAKQFEAMFMNLVIKQMRETVPDSGVMGDSSKVEMFQGMLDEEYSRMAGEHAPNGLAQMIYESLIRSQGLSDED